jgi:hypothetical protein
MRSVRTIAGVAVAVLMMSGAASLKAQGYGPGPQNGGGQYGPDPQYGRGPGGPPPPPPGPGQFGSTLRVNQSLMRGQSLVSNNGRFQLDFQLDGNVVLKHLRSGRVMWATGTNDKPAFRLTMQDDGNLVVYSRDSRPLWASGVTGPQMRRGQVLTLQDDGNLVVTSRGRVYWASGTQGR